MSTSVEKCPSPTQFAPASPAPQSIIYTNRCIVDIKSSNVLLAKLSTFCISIAISSRQITEGKMHLDKLDTAIAGLRERVSDEVLDRVFRKARTRNAWAPIPLSDALVRELY